MLCSVLWDVLYFRNRDVSLVVGKLYQLVGMRGLRVGMLWMSRTIGCDLRDKKFALDLTVLVFRFRKCCEVATRHCIIGHGVARCGMMWHGLA